MSQLKSRLLSVFLTLMMLLSIAPANVIADTTAARDAVVYITVNNKGVIASANDASIMANREVTVKDIDEDGKLTYDEALAAAHKAYNSEDGYSAPGGYVSKLWGIDTYNTLFFVNNEGAASGIGVDTVKDGDKLVASINKDDTYYADWYTFFDSDAKAVKTGEEFTLILKGYLGMAYSEEDKADVALSGISVGIWNEGVFSAIDGKTTDEDGKVTLSFDEAGTYYVSASGAVKDEVTIDWSTYETAEKDCPIIAPVCVVTVEEGEDEPSISDSEAIEIIYNEFSQSDYSSLTKTPLVFPLEYNDETYSNVISYIKAWALKNTGRDVAVSYTPYIYTTKYTDWSSGSIVNMSYDGMDINGEIIQDYFTNNAKKTMNRLDNVSFTVGSETSETITELCVSVNSLERTPQEIVDYVAQQLPFERIINSNVSKDAVVSSLGEKSGSSVALPNTCGLYNTTSATITWAAENISGKSDAFAVASTRKTTVIRPNVGEDDAVFDLTATITSKTDSAVSKTVTHTITIPAFEGVTVPIQVTEGANLSLVDSYYGSKVAVDDKYIVKADNSPEGYDLYNCTLHTSATGTAQKFTYTVSKDGYISKSGTINVTADEMETTVVELFASSDDDTKLKSLTITAPSDNSCDIISGLTFDKDTYEYNIEVSGIRTLKFAGETMAEGASVKITSYYSSLANANKGTLTTSGKAITTTCYLPDAKDAVSTIVITVTAPESSTQQETTRNYTINVKKSAASGPMTAFSITPSSTTNGKKDEWAGEDGETALEEVLNPAFVNGSLALGTYTVNYWRDKISVKPTASGCTILVGEETVESGKASSEIMLNVGINTIPIKVTDADSVVTEYTLTVYRKSQLDLTSAEVENGAMNKVFSENGSDRSNNGRFSYETETLRMKFGTNIAENEEVDICVSLNDTSYTGKAGEFIDIPVKDRDSAMLFVWLYRTVNGVKESQVYVINMSRMPATSPNSIASYLPAPGQFVNQPIYSNPDATLTGRQMITLGSFGGNIVYKYDTPIENDPMNPYGIDFIVEGNAFTNTDGTSAVSSGEPAAVMVSKDGETWYELAGSEYYDANTFHNITVTYENPDTSFAGAVNIPWSDDIGGSGVVLKNEHHTQAYYPNPATYNAYQSGIGKNGTYKAESVSFSGTKTAGAVYPAFGYADNHAAGDYSNSPETNPRGNKAANPYIENHYAVYNGDGFDLSWAVDSNGNPVELDGISYIKIYNPWLYDGGATGEKSPEIMQVLRVEPETEAVGVTDELTSLSVNGKAITLEKDKYIYDLDGEGASSFAIVPTSENADANIYVSNQRVVSGESSKAFAAVNKLRIIVQEDNKEPLIYILNFTNVETRESNAGLKTLTLTPGDDSAQPDADGNIEFTVSNVVSSIRFTPEMNYQRATAVLTGEGINEIPVSDKTASSTVLLNVGENSFMLTVTSADKTVSKSYNITVKREEGSSSSSSPDVNTIQVQFSLTGDTVHYDKATGESTGNHKNPAWIKSQSVTVPKGSTVKYLTELMLNNAGIDYVSDGVYVSEINGIGEFDNGPNSGWMYRHNSTIANEGYAARILSSGDMVKWFYTDDYTKEIGYEGNWDSVNNGSGSTTKKDDTATDTSSSVTVAPSASVDKNGVASAVVTAKSMADTVKEAAKNKTVTSVVVSPEIKGDATKVCVEVPKAAVSNIANDSGLNLTVATDIAQVTVSNEGLSKIDGDLSITTENKNDTVKVEIAVNGSAQKNITGGISVVIPKDGTSPDAVLVQVNEDGTEAVIKKSVATEDGVKAVLDGSATVKVVENTKKYSDTDGHWGKDAIGFVSSREIFSGTDRGFEPDGDMNRAMVVTTLFRLEDAVAEGSHDYNDIQDGAWYTDAVIWANSNDIVNGTETGFEPDGSVTREQLCTIMFRYANHIGMDTDKKGNLDGFKDSSEVSDWATEAMVWAAETGILTGKPDEKLDPKGYATRAEVAVIYQRLITSMIN